MTVREEFRTEKRAAVPHPRQTGRAFDGFGPQHARATPGVLVYGRPDVTTSGPANPTQALLAALSAFRDAADRVSLLPELERLAREADARDEVAEAVEEASESVESAHVLCELLRVAARLREALDEAPKATTLWNDLLAAQPVDAEALDALARLYGRAGDFTRAAEVTLRRARLLEPGPDRHARFAEASDLLLRTGAKAAALEALDESLSRRVEGDNPAAVHVRRGALLEALRPADAAASYALALASAEHAQAATSGLIRLLATPGGRPAAAAKLEPVFRQRGDTAQLVEVLQARSESMPEPALLLELARLREDSGEPRLALAAYLRAFAAAPADVAVHAELDRLAARLDARDELVAAYEEVLHADPNRADPSLLRRVAELHDALGNRDQALEAWEWAAEVSPDDHELLAAWADRCRRRGELSVLGTVLRRQLAAKPDAATRLKLLGELGRLCEDLSDFVGASHAYQDLSDAAPDDARVLKTLERLYEQTGNTAGLGVTLERALALAGDAPISERVALSLRLARLKLAPPEDDARALDLLREVLRLTPSNAQAVAALAQLASTPGPVQAAATELVTPALDALGDYPGVVQLLEAQLATQTGARARTATLRRIAELYAGPLDDADLAFLAITRALRETPHDTALLQRAIELSGPADAADALDLLLAELAGAQPPGESRLSLFRMLARRHDARAADDEDARDEAIAAWSEVLVQAPHDAEALDRLEELFATSGRLADLAVLWRQRVDAAPAEEKSAPLLRLASVQERSGDLDAAASTLLNLFAVTRSADTLAPLERVLGKAGRHLERAEALLRLAELAKQAGREKEVVDRLVQQARALTAAGEAPRAVQVYAEVLRRTPDEPRAVTDLVTLVGDAKVREAAAELLAGVFKAPGQREQRAVVLDALAGTPGLERGAAFRAELAALHEALGDVTQAFAGWLWLVRERPEDDTARAELERLALNAHFEEELVATCEELLERQPPLPRGLRRHLQATAARLYAGPMKLPDEAQRAWERLARDDRDALEAFTALEPIYREREAWGRLGEVLERQAALLTGRAKVDALRRLAALADSELRKPALAIEALTQVLDEAPDDASAVRELARLYEREGQPRDAAGMLERLTTLLDAAASPAEVADLSLQVGRLQLELGQPARAVELFARALALRADGAATGAVEGLLESTELPVRARAAESLEPLYRARGDQRRLAEALGLQLPTASPERRIALLEELARLREALGELPLAFLARQELYARRPRAEDAAELQRLAEAAGCRDELLESFTARLGQPLPDAEALELWRRIATTKQQLDDRAGAAKAWEQVASRTPEDPAPLETLTSLYEATRGWAELPRILGRRARLEPSKPKQVELFLRIAEIAETHLQDLPAAIEAAEAARTRGDARALPLLERLTERSGRYDELRALIAGQLEQATGDDALALRVRLARVEHRFRDDDTAALELLAAVRREAPRHPDAIAALEELMRAQRPASATAAAALEAHYQRQNQPALQAEALEVRAAAATDGERASLLHRVADLHESALGSPGGAFDVLARLLTTQPDDARALERLRELAGPVRALDRLASLLVDAAPRALESTRPELFRALATTRQRLGDTAGALEAVQALLALRPDDVPALEQATALLQGAARWRELEAVLQRRVALAASDEARAATLALLGELYESALEEPASAVDAWRRVLELRPDDDVALRRLDGLCVILERWPELAEVIGRRLHAGHPDRPGLLLRLAKVRREKLGNAAAALPLLGELLGADPQDAEARRELELLVEAQPGWEPAAELLLSTYRRAHDVEKLATWLDACATEALPGPRRRALWVELSELQQEQLGNAERAFGALAQAFREAPTELAVRDKLVTLAEAANAWPALAASFETVLPVLEQPHLAEISLALAQVLEERLGNPKRAVELYRAALELPRLSAVALAGLDRTLTALGEWQPLLPVLEARQSAAEEGPPRVALLLRLAQVADEHLGLDGRAAEAYRAVLVREPQHVDAARALESLYERRGETERLIEILERLLTLLAGGALRAARLKLARLVATRDPGRCVALCRQLLQDDPLHADAFALLSERFEAAKRWTDLEQLFQATLLVTLVPQDAAELAFRLAELTYRQLARPADAVARYRAVLDRSPGHVPSLEALQAIHEAAREPAPLAAVLTELAALVSDPARRRALHVRRTELFAGLGERDAAIAAAREALALDDGTPDGLEPLLLRLEPVLRTLDALPELAMVLERLARLASADGRTDEAVARLLELGEVELRQQDETGACAAFERALRLEPSQRTAYDRLDALYTQAGAWGPWASLAERFLEHLGIDERLPLLDRLVTAQASHLGDRRAAFDWALQAVRLDPGSAARRSTAEELGAGLKTLPVLAKVYAETLAGLRFGPAWEALALALAAVQDTQLDQLAAAERTLGELLAHQPAHAGALDALIRMYERRGLHERHVQTLEAKLETTSDPAARKDLLLRIAELQETALTQPAQAAHALRRLLELEPGVPNARRLVALHQRQQAWPYVLEALLEVRELSPKPEKAAVQLEIAALHEQALQEPDAAIAAYQDALALDPRSSEAFRGLERLFLQLERRGELLHAYEQRLAQKIPDEERIELHSKLAALWEERGDLLNADAALVAVLKLDGSQLRALEELARLRRATSRWRPLVETLARTVLVVTEPAKLAAVCTEAGQVHLEKLREPPAAEKWWSQALSHVPDHRPALEALVELTFSQARWKDGLAFLARVVQLETDASARAALEHRAGTVYEERLKDLSGARAAYQRALASEPVQLASLRRLRALFFQAGEWRAYEENLALEATRGPAPAERCAAAVELAAHFAQRERRPDEAIRWYEHALAARPDALEAAAPLADLLLAAERWPRAAEVLTVTASLLEREPQRRAERVTRFCQLAGVQRRLDQPRAALESYGHALVLEPVDPLALRGQVDVLEELGQLDEAARKLRLFDERHGAALPAAERAATRLERAQLHWKLGEAGEAQALAERTLELEPAHVEALRLLVDASDALSAYDKAATARQRLAALSSGDARHELLLELGAILRDRLNSPTRALDAFGDALKAQPGSRRALRELTVTFKAVGHNRKAADYLERLVLHPEQPEGERRQDTLELADLVGRQMGDVERAADVLTRALEDTPDFGEALETLEALLTKAKGWKRLAAAYEQLVRRHGEGADSVAERAALWGKLGRLRLERLADRPGALAAFERAALLSPLDVAAQEAFGDLALADFPERAADAVQAYLRALPRGGDLAKLTSAVALRAEREKDPDTGWLAARAAEVLGTVDARHLALLERVGAQAGGPPVFRAPLTDQAWRERLLHPLARGPIAQVMAVLAEPWAKKYSTSLSAHDVHPKKHAVDPRTVSHPALVDLLRIAKQLGFESIDLYSPYLAPQTSSRREAHPSDQVSVYVLPTHPPAVLVGEQLVSERDRVKLHAMCAQSLTALRPELALAQQLPREALEAVFEAALSVGEPDYASRVDPKVLKVEKKRVEKALSSQGREALTAAVKRYLPTAKPGDLPRFLEGAARTPLRVAVLVAGDLGVVRRHFHTAGATGDAALRELLEFSLGGDLHALRTEAGCALR